MDNRDGQALPNTDGPEESKIFRILDLNRQENFFSNSERLLLTMYHYLNKNFCFYEARLGSEGASQILEEEKKFSVVALAGESDAILFTRESYQEYPNLWVASDRRFRNPVQVSHLDRKSVV